MKKVFQSPAPISLGDIRQKFKHDGVLYPLQVFEANNFIDKNYATKYKEFRKKCQNQE